MVKLFPSSVEGWNTVFQAISVILIAGTVLAGAGAIITNRIMNRRQAKDLAAANSEAAKASKGVTDANLEIAKAKEGTAQAVRDTAKANEEVALLTKESLLTRFNLEKTKTGLLEARANVEKLQIAATDAKAAQQRVEIDLAKQKERAAMAELELAKLRPRDLTNEQQLILARELKSAAGARINVVRLGDREANVLANHILGAFDEAGWQIEVTEVGTISPPVYGVILRVNDAREPEAKIILNAFVSARVTFSLDVVRVTTKLPVPVLVVGLHPVQY